MKLKRLHIRNLRSVVDTGEFPVGEIAAFIGENNAGKSNILRAVDWLTSAGAGGVKQEDFNDPEQAMIIKGTFDGLTAKETRRWRSYLVDGQLILEKQIRLESHPEDSRKPKVKAEFHGYRAQPKEWFLSTEKIVEAKGSRPKWADIVTENSLPDYFMEDGKSNKTTYSKALERYLLENDVEYDQPDLSSTQALGLQSNVVAMLPTVYFLGAITDYNDEIDRRSSTSTFRRLMADLAERILKQDERYKELQTAVDQVQKLLNKTADESLVRLESLETIEKKIADILRKLMPSVRQVCLSIAVEETKEIFSRGVSLTVDDGIDTDVLAKGHGMQRCVVFSLLQALIMNEQGALVPASSGQANEQSIILAVEEPELYIHPQLAKLFYDVLRGFASTDQVLYSTHSPLFIDAFEYEHITLVQKPSTDVGTQVKTCAAGAFDGLDDRKVFQGLTRLNPSVNEMFFARRVLLVEGPEDQIAVTAVLRDEKRIQTRAEEIDWSVVVAGGKEAIPFLQRVLNAFGIEYAVLHDLDIMSDMEPDIRAGHEKTNATIKELAGDSPVHHFPVKLETSLGLAGKFAHQYAAHKYFLDPANISEEVRTIITGVLA